MWAQPASLKALARVESSSSRTPRNKASRSGPASAPASPRAASMPARTLVRQASARGAGFSTCTSRESVNTLARTAGRISVVGRHATRIVLPLGGAQAPRIKMVTRPVAPTQAWSVPCTPSTANSMYNNPPEARRASDTTRPCMATKGGREKPGSGTLRNPPPPADANPSALRWLKIPSMSPAPRATTSLNRPVFPPFLAE